MRLAVLPLVAALLLTGCGHRLTVQARDGSGGTGTATRGIGSGSIEVTINGKVYEGRWTAATAGGVGFGTLLTGSGGVATAQTMSVGGSSGLALLRSADGGTLRCEFVYSGMSGAGYGGCEDQAGKRYDLMIG
jgi:hypothetical protein